MNNYLIPNKVTKYIKDIQIKKPIWCESALDRRIKKAFTKKPK